jgi:hypothetical protein
MDNPQVTINIANLPWMPCDCGNFTFRPITLLKKMSAWESPSGREEPIPLDMVACESCGKIPSFFSKKFKDLPEELVAKKPISLDGE